VRARANTDARYQENLNEALQAVFRDIEGSAVGADYTAAGAWIYQADWSTLPGYVQAWLEGSVD
jgi:hypothetical protein